MLVNILITVTQQATPPNQHPSADCIISIHFFLPWGGTICVRDIDWVPSCHHLLFVAALFLPVVACVTVCLHCRPTEASFFLSRTTQTYPVAQISNPTTMKKLNRKETPYRCMSYILQPQSHTPTLCLFWYVAFYLGICRLCSPVSVEITGAHYWEVVFVGIDALYYNEKRKW